MRQTLLLIAVSGFMAASLGAAPILYTEPPDLPASGGPVFVLGIGQNVFNGTLSGCPNCGGDFQDTLNLSLPAGMHFVDGSIFATYTPGNANGTQHGVCVTNDGCYYTAFGSGLGNPFSGSSDGFLTISSPYTFLTSELAGSSSYTVTINVAADVPEPATGLLLIPAMAFLAFLKRSLAKE